MYTLLCLHERAHKTILCARKSVHANIKFVEHCMKLIFCMQINIKLSYSWYHRFWWAWPGLPKLSKINLYNISRKVRNEFFWDNFLCRWAWQVSINWYCRFWLVWPGMPKVLKITSFQFLCHISRKDWVMSLMFSMLINVKAFSKLIVLFLMGLARPTQITWVNLQYLCEILRNNSEMI